MADRTCSQVSVGGVAACSGKFALGQRPAAGSIAPPLSEMEEGNGPFWASGQSNSAHTCTGGNPTKHGRDRFCVTRIGFRSTLTPG